ncbi:MAG: flagellar export protein FliJ [Phycisphaerales bacterium]|nr:flagellar export protein FliJ [Phycisphaerales bacterium]
MPRFRFNLQPVLELREREEREKQIVFASYERERVELEDRIRRCQSMMDDEKRVMRDALSAGGVVDLRSVKMQAGATLGHHLDAHRAVLELAGVFTKLESARAELIRASAARKAVELLRERAYEAFRKELDAREARELDELAVMRHARTKEMMR